MLVNFFQIVREPAFALRFNRVDSWLDLDTLKVAHILNKLLHLLRRQGRCRTLVRHIVSIVTPLEPHIVLFLDLVSCSHILLNM